MVSVRRRRQQKSGVPKVTRRRKDKHRKIHHFGNAIIAANWDDKLTLSQNYAKLGLRVKLGKNAGGREKEVKIISPIKVDDDGDEDDEDLLEGDEEGKSNDIDDEDPNLDPYDPANILEGTAKIIRDKDGDVEKVVYGTKKLHSDEKDEVTVAPKEDSEVVKQLRELAERKKVKKEKKLGEMEAEALKDLYEKYGDDYEAMKWDKKLNPFQLSPGQLKRKLQRWHQQQSI
ncbi:DEKNAAC100186 [Brettanomyces naardenensis]|uniref:Nucleolar protein 16 n=1 Tax=Brettanomyces naardenensis TaxID=13370 RepID=A0A448YET3_BRENA|nr:DEKNAAC100186 [Brettanomyces naardenensis]